LSTAGVVQSDQYGPAPSSTASNPASATPSTQSPNQIPFVRASRRASQQDFAFTATLSAATTTQIGPMDIQTNGFLRRLELFVSAPIASGNSATVAFQQDGPFVALQNVTLQDPSSEFIISPYTGYELMLADKYFAAVAEMPGSDPRGDPNYVATSGSGGTGGSFAFVLNVPLEDRCRDAFCAVPNSAANKNYRFQGFLATAGTIYSTSPTTLQSVTINCTNFYWTEPPASIANVPTVGTPNGNGSVAYFDRETFSSLSSATTPTLIFKNTGRVYKNAIFILRNSTPAREDADWPNPMTIWVNGYPLYYKPQHTWWSDMSDVYGIVTSTRDVVGGLDTGVYVWYDLDSQAARVNNWGDANQYLATAASTKLQLVGSFGGGASSLVVLQRTIKPVTGAALYGR
jgi:hypothetical protein